MKQDDATKGQVRQRMNVRVDPEALFRWRTEVKMAEIVGVCRAGECCSSETMDVFHRGQKVRQGKDKCRICTTFVEPVWQRLFDGGQVEPVRSVTDQQNLDGSVDSWLETS